MKEIVIAYDSKTGNVERFIKRLKAQIEERNKPLFDLISRAEKWLATHSYTTRILKWDTKLWGEIPADFGRK